MDNSFVLYQVGHYGFLINAFLHKETYNKDKNAIYLLDKSIANDFTINFLKNNQNFSNVLLYNDKDIFLNLNTIEKIEEKTVEYFDDFLRKNNIDLNNCEDIYSLFDTFNLFGVYLTIKKIKFSMIECFKNQCQTDRRYHLNNAVYDEVIYKNKALTFDNKCVVKKYCFEDCIENDENTFFNVNPSKMLENLNKKEISNLIKKYNVDFSNLKQQKISCYVLNSSWMITHLNLEEKYYFYLNQLFLDYYCSGDNKILLKAHPNTDYDTKIWKEYFPNCEIMHGYFPSKLMDYIDDLKITKNINTGSTGSCSNGEIIKLPFNFFLNYKCVNKLYFALKLANTLNIDQNKFFHFGIPNDLIWSFCNLLTKGKKTSLSNFTFEKNSITIIDNIFCNSPEDFNTLQNNLNNINNTSVIIFLDTENKYVFKFNENITKNLIKLKINKIKTRNSSLDDTNPEILYVFCKDENKLNIIKNFEDFHLLNTTGSFYHISHSTEISTQPYEYFSFLESELRKNRDSSYFSSQLIYILQILFKKQFDFSKLNHYGLHNSVIWELQNLITGSNENKSVWSNLEFASDNITIINDIYWNPGNQIDLLRKNYKNLNNNSMIIFLSEKILNDFIADKNEIRNYITPIYPTNSEQCFYCCSKNKDFVKNLFN